MLTIWLFTAKILKKILNIYLAEWHGKIRYLCILINMLSNDSCTFKYVMRSLNYLRYKYFL